jgi:hypothetical protein
MRFHWYEAILLFLLWLVQFVFANLREIITFVYFGWTGIQIIRLLGKGRLKDSAFSVFPRLIVKHW